jgi:hypothetical protein
MDFVGMPYTEEGIDEFLRPGASQGGVWLHPLPLLALVSLVSERVLADAQAAFRNDPGALEAFVRERERIRRTRTL